MSSIPEHYRRADSTNKNRRAKLKGRLKRLIQKLSLPENEKVFITDNLMAILQEYAELWEFRFPNQKH